MFPEPFADGHRFVSHGLPAGYHTVLSFLLGHVPTRGHSRRA